MRTMKWPTSLMLIRHDTSEYNVLRDQKKGDPLYRRFVRAFNKNPEAKETVALALEVKEKFALRVGDAKTRLFDGEGRQAFETGQSLARDYQDQVPDIIFVSPYERTLRTLEHIARGWPALQNVRVVEEERIREQEHGLATLYSDWRVFETLHPEQRALRKLQGPYRYQYPQGESVLDVRLRNLSFTTTLTRDFARKRVLVMTHHLNILAMRANFERFGEKKFIHLDNHEKPINCGVTLYVGHPDEGENGRLKLKYYNLKLYK